MRCGKDVRVNVGLLVARRNPRECAVAKVKIVAEMQQTEGRNPRECAVAKICIGIKTGIHYNVATRANALWQRLCANASGINIKSVATRANALWQREARRRTP